MLAPETVAFMVDQSDTPCTFLTSTPARTSMSAMARNVVIDIIDDIDGTKDAEEVRFALNGAEYTIDLSKKNRSALEKALQPFIDAGTKVSSRRPRRSNPTTKNASRDGSRDLGAIREWAKAQGISVSDRGRIPAHVLEQYDNR